MLRRAGLLPAALVGALFAVLAARAAPVEHGEMERLFDEPVTTSATGKPQRVSEVPADMEIITAEDIRRSGADNLPDILQFVAGLDVRRYGFAAADVAVRGYNETSNPRLLVLVDGQQVYLDDLGRTQWYTFPVSLAEIRQIEIVRGPSTALFGFNAASGVINIVTFDPRHDPPRNQVTLRGGTQSYAALTAVGTGRVGESGGVRLGVDGFTARDFSPSAITPGDLAFRQGPLRRAADVDTRFGLAPGTELTVAGALVESRMWEATASPYYGTDTQRTNWSRVGLTSDTPAGLVSLMLWRNELRYAFDGASERTDLHDTVWGIQASDLFKPAASHVLRWGVDWRANNADSSDALAGRIGYAVISPHAMWEWQLAPSLSLTTAVRWDHFMLSQSGPLMPLSGLSSADFNRSLDGVSYNAGLVWQAGPRDTLRLTGGRGLQLPSIYDLGLQDPQTYSAPGQPFPTEYFLAYGQPRLRPAAVTNAELGGDHELAGRAAVLRGAVFVQRTTDVITNPYEATPVYIATPSGVGLALAQAANTGSSSAAGVELGLHGELDGGWRWRASYSFISIADRLGINRGGLYSPQDFAHGTPSHVVTLSGGRALGRWEFDGGLRWQSRYRDYRVALSAPTLTPVWVNNYVVMNARIATHLAPNLELALTAQQFNNAYVLQSGGPPVERRVFLSLTAGL